MDRNDSAYQGIPKTQEGANDLIREVLNSKNPVVRTKCRNGQEVRDVLIPLQEGVLGLLMGNLIPF